MKQFILDNTGKECAQCSGEELYRALLFYVKRRLADRGYQDGKKKLYYISAEFLTGKLLSNNFINLGLYDQIDAFLRENGKSLAEIEELEPEPSLGNGGLGRLAACFLDSMLGLPGGGIGLNYHLGLFKQEFQDSLPGLRLECASSEARPDSFFVLSPSLLFRKCTGYPNRSVTVLSQEEARAMAKYTKNLYPIWQTA